MILMNAKFWKTLVKCVCFCNSESKCQTGRSLSQETVWLSVICICLFDSQFSMFSLNIFFSCYWTLYARLTTCFSCQGSSKSRVTLFGGRLSTEFTSSQRDLCYPRVQEGQPGSSLRVERPVLQMKAGAGSSCVLCENQWWWWWGSRRGG